MKNFLFIIGIIILCTINWSCKKLSVSTSNSLEIINSNLGGVNTINWKEFNIRDFKNFEILASPKNDFTNIKSEKFSLFTSTDPSVTSFDIPKIILDTMNADSGVYIQMQIHLTDRSIISNVLQLKGNSVFSVLGYTYIIADPIEKYILLRASSNKFLLYDLVTKESKSFTTSTSFTSVTNWRTGKLNDGSSVLINFDLDITIINPHTFQEIIKIPRGSRVFGGCKIANDLLYCISKHSAQATSKILIFHSSTGTLLDSISTTSSFSNSLARLSISPDNKFLFTYENLILSKYAINTNGSLTFINSTNQAISSILTDIEINETSNEVTFELDNVANYFNFNLQPTYTLDMKMPSLNSSFYSNDKKHIVLIDRLNTVNQIKNVNILDANTKQIIRSIVINDGLTSITNSSFVIIDRTLYMGTLSSTSLGTKYNLSKILF